jgi:hypothetical protein
MVVIKKGTPVAGAIVEASPSQPSSRPARLVFAIRQTSSVSGLIIRLRTSPDKSGEQRVSIGRPREALLLWAAGGETFRAFVDGDYSVPAPPAEPPVPREAILTNKDVMKLVSAGISDELVITKLQASRTAFRIGTDLIQLKQAGVIASCWQ